MQLRTRLENHLDGRKEALKEGLAHYGSIFEVEPEDLQDLMKQVWFHRDGTELALGSAYGPETHGGGLLSLLLEHWRPDSRASRLDDEFWFDANRKGVRLEEIYRGHQRQIFLPVPGTVSGEIQGELPDSPQLPRMRSRYWTRSEAGETDAYQFLALLTAREADPSATWSNGVHQELSLDLLMENTRDYYLGNRDTAGELADHSHLHLVEVLLAYGRRRDGAVDADAIKRRFLEIELARDGLRGDDGNEVLGHYVESLGVLVADPRVSWTSDEKQQVKRWLRRLERDRFHDLEPIRLQDLTHLLKGLRMIGDHQDRLGG
jgi:hypothetical protein